jgi:hypothetical protein
MAMKLLILAQLSGQKTEDTSNIRFLVRQYDLTFQAPNSFHSLQVLISAIL